MDNATVATYENISTESSQDTVQSRRMNSYTDPFWFAFPPVPWQAHYFIGSVLTASGCVGAIGNFLVIWIFTRFERQKTPANTLTINLAMSDFLATCLQPMAVYSSFVEHWTFGQIGCEIYAAGTGLFGLMSIVTLTAISIERFAVICAKPFTGKWAFNYSRAIKAIVIIWLYCLALMLPPFFGWGKFTLEGFLTSCSFDYLTHTPSNRNYMVYLFFFGFFLPVGCITVCYSIMLSAICKHEKTMAARGDEGFRRQSTSHKPYKRVDTKTAKIVFTLIALFIVSWSPYALVTLIAQFGDRSLINPWISSLPALFAKASTIYNPIVYGISHPTFRKGLKRCFVIKYLPRRTISSGRSFQRSTTVNQISLSSISSSSKQENSGPELNISEQQSSNFKL